MNCKLRIKPYKEIFMLKAIINANIVLENGIIWDGTLLVENDTIKAFGKARDIEVPTDAEIIDAAGAYVGPGFVDIHVHGGAGFATYIEIEKAANHFLKHGATSILATPAYFMGYEEHMDAIQNVKEAMGKVETLRGIYFEGPYTNPKYGCNVDKNPWRDAIDEARSHAMVDAAGDLARVWAIAPEREGIKEFMSYARKVNPNVEFAIAHSEATPKQIRDLGSRLRPSIQTHSTNATGIVFNSDGIRGCGPDEYSFKDPELYTELISDSAAIHVHPDMQQLILHTKGVHRVILVTDSTTEEGVPSEIYGSDVADLNFDHNGELAGSKMTMDQACRNIMTHTNCGIAQAFLMASTNPAMAVGLYDERGSIEAGKKADLVFVDDRFNVKKVMLGGKLCAF